MFAVTVLRIQTLLIDGPMLLNILPKNLLEGTVLILNCKGSKEFTSEPEY